MGASKPRKQQLNIIQHQLEESIFAVIRVAWYRNGKQYEIEEMHLEHDVEHVEYVLHGLVERCLRAGADVMVMSSCSAEELGLVS